MSREKVNVLLQYCAPQRLITKCFGMLSQCKIKFVKNWCIQRFIRKYSVNMEEALFPDKNDYVNFHHFFIRALKEDIHALPTDPHAVISPADSTISEIGTIEENRIYQAKNFYFSLEALLGGSPALAEPLINGTFCTFYLAPKDYHRVHMPLDGILEEMIYIPGKLFSVNPTTVRNVPNVFARNERVVCLFQTPYGPMAVILVGAMIVGSIHTSWSGCINPKRSGIKHEHYPSPEFAPQLKRGEELGFFSLGSTVIVLFGPNMVKWSEALQAQSVVRMGESIGIARAVSS